MDKIKTITEDVNVTIENIKDRFECIEWNTENYLKDGITLVLQLKFKPRLTHITQQFGSAKIVSITGNQLVVKGFLNDVESLLALIQ